MSILTSAMIAASLGAAAPAVEAAIAAPGPQGDLAGTLIAPEQDQPVVLIIPGSGPTDRDGNSAMGFSPGSYKWLAQALAQHGIGSVRVDKRGTFGSAAAIADANDVTIAAYADGVHSWVASARDVTGAPCVWVMGHSEGGLVALEAAQRGGDICGVILVASMGRTFGTILREQFTSNQANAPILDDALAAIDTLENGGDVDTSAMHPALQGIFAPQVQGYLRDIMARDPAELAVKVDLPMLIVSGGKDIQTPVADGEALAAAQPDATFVQIDDMNHVLKLVEGDDRASNIATYSDPSLPVAPDLVAAITRFVTADRDAS